MWYLPTGGEFRALEDAKKTRGPWTFAVSFGRLAYATDDSLKFFTYKSGLPERVIKGEWNDWFALAFSPDGKLLAAGAQSGAIRLFDMASGREVRTFKIDEEARALAFRPDNGLLACGTNRGNIYFWGLQAGEATQPPRCMQGHWFLESLCFSPDGRQLAAAGNDGIVRLWTLGAYPQTQVLPWHRGHVHDVSFSCDGRLLASASDDGAIGLWRAEEPQAAQTASAAGNVAADEAAWRGAINLLPAIDPKADAVAGDWTMSDGGLLCRSEGNFPRIEIPYQPPEEYDFRITFTRLEGAESVTQMLSRSTQSFAWIMGGWGDRVFGFELLGGRSGDNNPTTVKVPACIENGRPNTSVVEVRNGSVRACLNGVPMAQWRTDYQDMASSTNWKLRDPKLLGIGCLRCSVLFERVEVREVTGKGRFTRGAPGAR
jgi:hypothetical protein